MNGSRCSVCQHSERRVDDQCNRGDSGANDSKALFKPSSSIEDGPYQDPTATEYWDSPYQTCFPDRAGLSSTPFPLQQLSWFLLHRLRPPIMKVLQSLLVLFFALAIQVLTSVAKKPKTQTPAIQTPTTATPVSYKPGTMIRVKSSAWEKKKDRNKNSDIPHFGVVVGQNTRNKKYKIVHISANLPAKYNHRDDASKYHPNAKKKNNKINTGRPELVAHKHLQPANANDGWGKMEDKKLLALQTLINKNHPSANLRTGNHGLGRSSQPKSNQNGPKGKSRQFQGKKPRPRPIQSTRGKGLKLRSVQVNVP